MFEIFIVACLIADPGQGATCREFSIGTSQSNPTMGETKTAFANWAEKHEGWQVQKWGTRRLGRFVYG